MADHEVIGYEMKYWADVADLFIAPECCWGTLQTPFQSRDDIKAKLESPPPNMHRLIALAEDRAVGLLGLRCGVGRRAHTGDIGMFVHPDYHGKGVGTALMEKTVDLAESWLGLSRLELTVFVDNRRAIALYEKFDFVVEGILKQYARRDGELVDVQAMARIR